MSLFFNKKLGFYVRPVAGSAEERQMRGSKDWTEGPDPLEQIEAAGFEGAAALEKLQEAAEGAKVGEGEAPAE